MKWIQTGWVLGVLALGSARADVNEVIGRLIGPDQQVYLDRLPPNLPFALPGIQQARVVGSTVWQRQDSAEFNARILLDLSPQGLDALHNQLEREGWVFLENLAGGFPQPIRDPNPTFHKASLSASLALHRNPRHENAVDLLVFQGPALTESLRQRFGDPRARLPMLGLPAGTRVVSVQNQGGNIRSSGGVLHSERNLADLHGFLARQLEAAGWTRIATHQEARLQASSYRYDLGGTPYFGFLSVVADTQQPRMFYGSLGAFAGASPVPPPALPPARP